MARGLSVAGVGGVRDAFQRAGLSAFRRMPIPARRAAVRALTPRFTVGAVIVIQRPAGEVLMVRQRHTGHWALPGGLLDRGEGPREAIAREVAEELGITFDVERLDPPTVHVDAAARRVDVIFRSGEDVQPVRFDDPETLAIGWQRLERLPDVTSSTLDVLRAVGLR
jgi:8-oxo-dGTP diphosphatase